MGYTIEAIERRRQIIRVILFIIILGTTPLYCMGFLLWGTAPARGVANDSVVATNTPIGINLTPTKTLFPTLTPLFGSATSVSPLLPTPLQFVVPGGGGGNSGGGGGVVPPTATFFIPPVIPTAAPSLTPFPTNPPPPTAVPPTNPPPPTQTPLPVDTPLPPPTDAPPPTDEPPPTVEAPPTEEVLPGS